MTFQAPYDIMSMRNAVVREDALKQEQQQYNQKMLFDGLMQLGGAIKGMQDESAMMGAMDRGVGLMSDLGAIKPDIRDAFMNADKKEKPLLFDLLRQGAFSPYAAGQSAGFQAKAWDEYKSKWPAGGGDQFRNKYGYRYPGS